MTQDPGLARALATLEKVFGHRAFRGLQQSIVSHLLDGGDALVLMPTGAGKSLCYQLPALLREGVAIVVSPLIALMQDQVAAMRELGVAAAFLNSTQTVEESREIERALRAGRLDLLYLAPERLLTDRCLELLDQVRIGLIAIDEAHCVSQWGHDFRPEYIGLSVLADRFAGVPRVALTATADPATRREIVERLRLHDAREFVTSFDRPNLFYRIVEKQDPRRQLLDFLRTHHPSDAGIVYCATRDKVDQTAAYLVQHGVRAVPYHAGHDTAHRTEAQARFQREDGLVVVATIAFGMGIDKPDVRFVAHLDLPRSLEGYYQETGRAGRDGLPADAWMAYGLADVVQQRHFIDASPADEAFKRVAGQKLDAMLALCETTDCRRIRLLGYFGEQYRGGGAGGGAGDAGTGAGIDTEIDAGIDAGARIACGHCDNCTEPPQLWDATQAVRKLLSAIYRCEQASGFPFGAQHVIDVLRGQAGEKIRRFGHDRLPVHGIGADLSANDWRSILRQVTIAGLVRADPARFNALCLTAESRPVLRGEVPVMLRRPSAPPVRARGAQGRARAEGGSDAAARLDGPARSRFERLRAWRASIAKEKKLPAYVIFHDATLLALATRAPASLASLGTVPGIGERKIEAYGAAVLEALAVP
ncbi:MAG: RecQ family ATP-dependent DNA helicase [Lautropia sp.]